MGRQTKTFFIMNKLTQKIILLTLFLIPLISLAQKEQIITGVVVDTSNKPVKNAIIYVDNIKQSKIKTNRKGKFKLKLRKTPKLISAFSLDNGYEAIGYKQGSSPKIQFTKDSKINIRYSQIVSELNNKTYAKASKTQYFTNIYDYIRAKAPNVTVFNDNQLRIRSAGGSFLSSAEPLIIVNDAPNSDISTIVPNNIKSFTVLKGASAGSYGIRGANGVIVIKTK